MLVQRVEWQAKPGHVDEALALLRELRASPNVPKWTVVYRTRIGQGSLIALEWQWKSLAEYEKAFDTWNATPEAKAFFRKWNEYMLGSTQQIWTTVEI